MYKYDGLFTRVCIEYSYTIVSAILKTASAKNHATKQVWTHSHALIVFYSVSVPVDCFCLCASSLMSSKVLFPNCNNLRYNALLTFERRLFFCLLAFWPTLYSRKRGNDKFWGTYNPREFWPPRVAVSFVCAHSITQVYRHVNTFLQNIFKNLKYNAVSSMFFAAVGSWFFAI